MAFVVLIPRLKPAERKRTYVYGKNVYGKDDKISYTNVTGIAVSDSGNHYLNCDQGKVIVSHGWKAIEIDVDEWTYPKELNIK